MTVPTEIKRCNTIPDPAFYPTSVVNVDHPYVHSISDANPQGVKGVRKGWFKHTCPKCEDSWACEHEECGDVTHGCTRGSSVANPKYAKAEGAGEEA
jgi:hypothetical protein